MSGGGGGGVLELFHSLHQHKERTSPLLAEEEASWGASSLTHASPTLYTPSVTPTSVNSYQFQVVFISPRSCTASIHVSKPYFSHERQKEEAKSEASRKGQTRQGT